MAEGTGLVVSGGVSCESVDDSRHDRVNPLDEIGDGSCQLCAGLGGVGGPVEAKADGDSPRLKIDVEIGETDAA